MNDTGVASGEVSVGVATGSGRSMIATARSDKPPTEAATKDFILGTPDSGGNEQDNGRGTATPHAYPYTRVMGRSFEYNGTPCVNTLALTLVGGHIRGTLGASMPPFSPGGSSVRPCWMLSAAAVAVSLSAAPSVLAQTRLNPVIDLVAKKQPVFGP